MKYGELKDQIGMTGPRPFLFCPVCQGEFSANAGDYWDAPKSKEIICGECDEPMLLMTKKTIYEQVEPQQKGQVAR